MSAQDDPQEAGFYADGTSGWSGGDSSRERAVREDLRGRTRLTQEEVLALVRRRGYGGLTVHEGEVTLDRGHGAVSGALTRLHRSGKIVRITERRFGQEVYVLPEYVHHREEAPYRPQVGTSDRRRILALEQQVALLRGIITDAREALDHGDAYRIRQALERAPH